MMTQVIAATTERVHADLPGLSVLGIGQHAQAVVAGDERPPRSRRRTDLPIADPEMHHLDRVRAKAWPETPPGVICRSVKRVTSHRPHAAGAAMSVQNVNQRPRAAHASARHPRQATKAGCHRDSHHRERLDFLGERASTPSCRP